MAVFWVTEVIPLPVTSFIPIIVFPITGVLGTVEVCMAYVNVSWYFFMYYIFFMSFTPYPAHGMVDRKNVELRHSSLRSTANKRDRKYVYINGTEACK